MVWTKVTVSSYMYYYTVNLSPSVIIRDILKMLRNKSFDVKAKFGAIYSASKTEKYLLKNSTIGNRLLF